MVVHESLPYRNSGVDCRANIVSHGSAYSHAGCVTYDIANGNTRSSGHDGAMLGNELAVLRVVWLT